MLIQMRIKRQVINLNHKRKKKMSASMNKEKERKKIKKRQNNKKIEIRWQKEKGKEMMNEKKIQRDVKVLSKILTGQVISSRSLHYLYVVS